MDSHQGEHISAVLLCERILYALVSLWRFSKKSNNGIFDSLFALIDHSIDLKHSSTRADAGVDLVTTSVRDPRWSGASFVNDSYLE